jgi:hypothetical protein
MAGAKKHKLGELEKSGLHYFASEHVLRDWTAHSHGRGAEDWICLCSAFSGFMRGGWMMNGDMSIAPDGK